MNKTMNKRSFVDAGGMVEKDTSNPARSPSQTEKRQTEN